MKVYEYKNGKVNTKHLKDYAKSSKKYRVMKDLYSLFISISLVSIALSVVIAFSVISVVFYDTSLLFGIFIDILSAFFSWRIILFFWNRYKKDI